MRIQDMKALAEIAKQGSLSKAAENLYTTQPVLSRIIQNIESEIGVTLFRRIPGKKIEFTPAGLRFNEGIIKILSIYDDTLHALKEERTPLRICIPPESALNIMKFLKETDLNLDNYDIAEVSVAEEREKFLKNNECDVIITRMPLLNPRLKYQIFYQTHLGMWLKDPARFSDLAQQLPGHKYRTLSINVLNDEPLTLFASAGRLNQIATNMFHTYKIHPNILGTYRSGTYLLSLVENNVASTIFHPPREGQDANHFFEIAEATETYDYAIAYLPDTERIREIQSFGKLLTDYFKDHADPL